ncbi:hypothetical protein [Oceanobacillus sp. Castelsardo]|uniref:hypothetical protein n=1 Tax=Oceanobacillus sp. Castelsardo TaxID=1851204 RepID=UPI001E5AE876|nr:hypothetical protein [Oceanobacillus sp. Castelsardo]
MKTYYIPILLVLLLTFMVGSFFILRLDSISNSTVIILTLSLMIVPPAGIYWFFIRPKSLPKLFIYFSFILCLGMSYIIIPSSQKGFFNQILVWLIPVLEVSIILIVVYSIIKSIFHYKANNKNRDQSFIDVVRISLEPKLGTGFLLEAVLTELSVLYYSIFIRFRKPNRKEKQNSYTYHKTSQIKMIVILFSILIVVEGVFFHYLIH